MTSAVDPQRPRRHQRGEAGVPDRRSGSYCPLNRYRCQYGLGQPGDARRWTGRRRQRQRWDLLVTLDGSWLKHRRLCAIASPPPMARRRSPRVPYADDPQPNLCLLCLRRVPDSGAGQPAGTTPVQDFGSDVLNRCAIHHPDRADRRHNSQCVSTYETPATWHAVGGGHDPRPIRRVFDPSRRCAPPAFHGRGIRGHARANEPLNGLGRLAPTRNDCLDTEFASMDWSPSPNTCSFGRRLSEQSATDQYRGDRGVFTAPSSRPMALSRQCLQDRNGLGDRQPARCRRPPALTTTPFRNGSTAPSRSPGGVQQSRSTWAGYRSAFHRSHRQQHADLRDGWNQLPVTTTRYQPVDADALGSGHAVAMPVTHWSGVLNPNSIMRHAELYTGIASRGRELQDLLLTNDRWVRWSMSRRSSSARRRLAAR